MKNLAFSGVTNFFFSIFIWYLMFNLVVLNGENMFLFITAVHQTNS